MDYSQRTIRQEVSCTGLGLHSGRKIDLTIRPAPPGHGIQFIRRDLPNHPQIQANYNNVIDTNLSTTIGINGARVSTIEHLMAAFFGLGIDNALVEVNGPEVPAMDGSSAPFIFLLKGVGIKEQKAPKQFIIIKRPFRLEDGNRSVSIQPSKELRICYTIDFHHPLLRNQHYEICFSGKSFIEEISKARTFGFLKDVNTLRENGLAKGGSLDNAIVIDEFRILNEDGLRYKDEFVRHKILDFIGDLSLLRYPVLGYFQVEKSGHCLNQKVLRELMKNNKYWSKVSFNNAEECIRNSVKIPAFGSLEPVPA